MWWLDEAKTTWDEHIQKLHNLEEENTDAAEAMEQVKLLYTFENETLEKDREIFNIPLEQRLLLPWQTLTEWVASTWPIV